MSAEGGPCSTADSCSFAVPNDSSDGTPGKIVSFIGSDIKFLKVEVKLNNKIVIAVIDSGAERSLISSKLAQELELDINKQDTVFRVIGQKRFETLGSMRSRASIHGIEMKEMEIIVFPSIANKNISLLLGIDFIRANNLEVPAQKHLLIKHYDEGGRVEMYLDPSVKLFRSCYVD